MTAQVHTPGTDSPSPGLQPPGSPPLDYPRRFGWPMRLFLCAFLFDMIFRGVGLSLVDWREIAAELEMETAPKPLPSRTISAYEHGTHPRSEKNETYAAALRSAGRFLVPWPNEKTREKLQSPADGLKFAATWLIMRLELFGNVSGVDQQWLMYSPNVATDRSVARVRLIYADGSTHIVRGRADPEDLTRATHWFEEKRLQAEMNAHLRLDVRLGYCRWLCREFAIGPNGSPLSQIEFYEVRYVRPPPGEDVVALLKAQTGPPADQIGPVFWRFDVATQTGRDVPPPEENHDD